MCDDAENYTSLCFELYVPSQQKCTECDECTDTFSLYEIGTVDEPIAKKKCCLRCLIGLIDEWIACEKHWKYRRHNYDVYHKERKRGLYTKAALPVKRK